MNRLSSKWPRYSAREIEAVANVLRSGNVNYWTGSKGREFEEKFAAWCGVEYAVALANGSLALECALKALGLGNGDEVIVTCRTFIASVSSIINVGAIPVFADVDRDTGNISASTIEPKISKKTRAIICVHLAGMPCDMDPILQIASEKGLFVIEDCAQAHGAKYRGKPVGSLGHIAAWSFCQDKIMTTGGEGGMVTTNDRALWSKVWSAKDHGKTWESVYQRNHPSGFGFRWLHDCVGSNYRMTEMQSVLGLMQLEQIEFWNGRRRENASEIRSALLPFSGKEALIRLPSICFEEVGTVHAYYKFYAYLNTESLPFGWSRDRIVEEINHLGVPCLVGSCPEVYLEGAFASHISRPERRLPVARELGARAIMFLVHPTLDYSDIKFSVEVIQQVFESVLLDNSG